MKKLKNILFTFLVFAMTFALQGNVKATEGVPAYVVQVHYRDMAKYYSASVFGEGEAYEGFFVGNDGVTLTNFDGEQLHSYTVSNPRMNEINMKLVGDSNINTIVFTNFDYSEASEVKYKVSGDGTLKFIPAKYIYDGGPELVLVKNETEQKELLKKYIVNYDELEINYNDGTVYINREPYQSKIESENGTYFLSEEKLNDAYTLSSVDVTDKFSADDKKSFVKENQKLLAIYDVSVMNGDVVVPMEDGSFVVMIKRTEAMKNYSNFKVLYIDDDMTTTEMETEYNDEYIGFKTTHLSNYAVIGEPVVASNTTPPNTFDGITNSIILGMVALISVGGVTLFLRKKVNEM